MDDDFLICNDDRCVLMAEDLLDDAAEDTATTKFNQVIADLSKVYPKAILVGAVAAAKYVRNPRSPRETEDIDVLLGEKDYAEFLIDQIPESKLKVLETYFDNSDSVFHSLRHKETGVYVDLLSTESTPIRKRIARHVLHHRDQATHLLVGEDHWIDILQPELLLAMKVNRYGKDPKTDRGLSDRLDIEKILKTLMERQMPIDHGKVKSFLSRHEITKYEAILEDVSAELAEPPAQ